MKLDEEIHGLAHITQLGINIKEKINSFFNVGDELDFEILSISPSDHRLGLKLYKEDKKKTKKKEEKEEKKDEKKSEKKDKKEKQED